VPFYGRLDLIGLEGYFPLMLPGQAQPPSVAALSAAWHSFTDSAGRHHDYVSEIAAVQRRIGKPVIFTEVGYASALGATVRPAVWTATVSQDEQANAYEALFGVFSQQPWFRGFFYWDMDATGYDPADNKFDPRGKLAEQTLRNWWHGGGGPRPNPQPSGSPGGPLDVVLMHAPSGPHNTGSALFTFSSDRAGVTFSCRVDSADWSPCSSPLRLDGVVGGFHNFAVRAEDGGQRSPPVVHGWTVG